MRKTHKDYLRDERDYIPAKLDDATRERILFLLGSGAISLRKFSQIAIVSSHRIKKVLESGDGSLMEVLKLGRVMRTTERRIKEGRWGK